MGETGRQQFIRPGDTHWRGDRVGFGLGRSSPVIGKYSSQRSEDVRECWGLLEQRVSQSGEGVLRTCHPGCLGMLLSHRLQLPIAPLAWPQLQRNLLIQSLAQGPSRMVHIQGPIHVGVQRLNSGLSYGHF